MATKTLKTVSKISVKIWQPIISKLDEKLDAACLRRDAYLAKVLEVEMAWLDREVSTANSEASYDFVAKQLDLLDRKLVSLALPPDLTAQLNEICSRKRIVRDAFFNRLFLLLAASPETIDALLFGDDSENWRSLVWGENKHEGSFFQNGFYPLEPFIDPFRMIRRGMEMRSTDSAEPVENVYTTIFDQAKGSDLLALSCYLPDVRIPGHVANLEQQRQLDELLAGMGI